MKTMNTYYLDRGWRGGLVVVAESLEKAAVIKHLEECADNDYFERGLELAIEKAGIKLEPVDISDLFAVEVDFQADLERANKGLV